MSQMTGTITRPAPFRIGYHADALDARGHSLPDKTWGWEMPVLADFHASRYELEAEPRPGCLSRRLVEIPDDSVDALAAARAWAEKVMAADDRVFSVVIRESIQQYEGCHWTAGRGVETIRRPEPATPAHDHSRFSLCHCGYYWE